MAEQSEADLPSWHDATISAFRLDVVDGAGGVWRSDLILEIDYIVEWICGTDGSCRWRVAPATLTFHDSGDLRIAVDCGDSGGQSALFVWSIHEITRQRIIDQKVCFDRPYYRWRVALNWPQGGEITFCASGFTQILLAEPTISGDSDDDQRLTSQGRS